MRMSKKKIFIAKNVRKRKTYFSLLLVCLLFLGLGFSNLVSNLSISGRVRVKKYITDEDTLYAVLENAALEGTYAKKYEGDHKDSFVKTGKKDIYYWYGSSNANSNSIQDMNNVIFADQCWKMIRTTDTGGVKLMYNGEAENNQCLNTRGNHVGYGSRTSQNLASNYYYGTSYEYDKTNKIFSLSGTLEQVTWNRTTGSSLIGKYTCKGSNETDTCATLYLIESYNNSTDAYVIPLNSNSYYTQFGAVNFNAFWTTFPYVGYMYKNTYSPLTKKDSKTFTIASSTTVNTSYYYSDTIDYGTITTDQYTLVNPLEVSSLSDYSVLVGKYYMATNASGTTAYYVVARSGTALYCRTLSGGDLNISLTIGDSYTEENGVYVLTNPVNISFVDWYNGSYSDKANKYICDGNYTSCSVLKHTRLDSDPSRTSYTYWDSTVSYLFSESVSYENGTYTMTGDIKLIWDMYSSSDIANHHYTCLSDSSITCTSIKYYHVLFRNYMVYGSWTGLSDINAVLDQLFYVSDINTNSSIIKNAVEAWYQRYLLDYDDYIEDTIYCNDRTITGYNGWNPNGGSVLSYMRFNANSTSLACSNLTDQFSTHNSSALLKYKVALITRPELNLLGNDILRSFGAVYWTLSPSVYNDVAHVARITASGSSNDPGANTVCGVHPVISLNPRIGYVYGDGSMANPYLIDDGKNEIHSITLSSQLFTVPNIGIVGGTVILQSDDYIVTSFKLNGTLVEGNSFVMPGEDVTITDIQYAPWVYTITNSNSSITVPATGRYGNTITVTSNSEDYVVTSFKMNGTLVEGDSFVMPFEDVTITDVQLTLIRFNITINDSTITVPSTGRVGDTINLTANDYYVTSFKMNGTLVEGNSFVMPSENVSITDISKKSCVTVESAHNPYANNINNVVYYENTFTGATSLTILFTYQTEGTTYDWIYLYDTLGSSTPFGNKKYGGTTVKTETLTFNTDYVKIVFRTDGSNCNYYGFKAIIIPNYE